MPVYFEDVNVGDDLPSLVKGPVIATQLVRYSGASGDFNPIHTVPEIAQQVGLPGLIAHGMLVMAWAGQTLTEWAGPGSLRHFKVRFTDMTHLNETVVCEAKVTDKSQQDGETVVSGKLTVKGQADGSQKIKGEFTVVLPTRN